MWINGAELSANVLLVPSEKEGRTRNEAGEFRVGNQRIVNAGVARLVAETVGNI